MSDYIDLFLEKLHLQCAIVARPVEALLSYIIVPSASALFSLPPSLSLFHSPSLLGQAFCSELQIMLGLTRLFSNIL